MTKFAAIAAFAAAALAGAAQAQPLTTRIAVSDLDFARGADVARFEQRLQQAGDERCRPERHSQVVVAACRDALRREALSKLGAARARMVAEAKIAERAYAVARR